MRLFRFIRMIRESVDFQIDPSPNQVMGTLRRNQPDQMRGLIAAGQMLVWNSFDATHHEILQMLAPHHPSERGWVQLWIAMREYEENVRYQPYGPLAIAAMIIADKPFDEVRSRGQWIRPEEIQNDYLQALLRAARRTVPAGPVRIDNPKMSVYS